MGDSQLSVVRNGKLRQILSLVEDRSAFRLSVSCQDLHRLLLAVSLDSGNAQNLPGLQGKAEIIQLLRAELVRIVQILYFKNFLAELLRRLVVLQLNVAAYHEAGNLFQSNICQIIGSDGTSIL